MKHEAMDTAASLLAASSHVVVLTGAGISTDSGIPDFRGPNGLWTRNPEAERASNIRHYVGDPEVRRINWQRRAAGELWADVEPNAGHHAIVHLEELGKLHTLITQNVDELHQQAGTSPDKIVEIHGTTRKVKCLVCGWRAEMEVVLQRVRAGDPDPHCTECGGILKSDTVSFGQSLDPENLERAEMAAHDADLFLAVGTSLAVFPINETARIAKSAGAKLVIINREPTPFDLLADVVIHDSISDVLPAVVGLPVSRIR